jgi:cytidylate kinase
MPVITIRGQMGSGAPEIGKMLADRLGIDYVDREIISDVAKRIKWSKEGVADKESPPGTLLGRIAEALGKAYPMGNGYGGASLPVYEIGLDDTRYLVGLESVIKDLASNNAVVIRGRGSQFILKDSSNAVHVLVVAPEALRVKRIVSEFGLDEPEAKKQMLRSDHSHHEFIKRYFEKDLENPVNYDIVLNTEKITFEDAVDIIIQAVRKKARGPESPAKT